ncbi:phage antirepressor [Blautia argi]|uniref:phage antirepressor n=1 Tax=Blautia argi TaxID=1912897 RepID=UPI00294317C2|nr:BRO family protein [Blautia argi]
MSDLQVFKNEEFGEIRTATINNEPMFCLADVCRILEIKNVSDCKSRLMTKGIATTDTLTNGGVQKMTFISEANLYKTIFQSRKESAEKFTDWVTSEVLPSIRKHGIYATDNVIDNILNNPDFGIELLAKLKEERTARVEAEKKNAILTHINKTYTMTEIAKELNMKSAVQLNKILSEKKIQYHINGTWVMYSKYSNLGYEEIKQEVLDSGRVIYHRRITQLGREFILGLFSGNIII